MLKLIAIVALVLLVASGYATPLLPGGTVPPDSFTAFDDVTLLAHNSGTWVTPGSGGSGAAIGTFIDAVYSTTTPGTLDFVYQFSNASTSHNSITETSALSFLAFSPLDVGFMTNGALLPGGIFVNGSTTPGQPGEISEDVGGSTVTFDFNVLASENVTPGVTSSVLVIRAIAPHGFTSGLDGVIAGGTTNIRGFEPSVVPEPSLFLPVGAGLMAAIALGRRKVAQRT